MKTIHLPSSPAIDHSQLSPLPADLVRFVRTLAERPEPPFERRKSPRIPLSIPVPVTPLDKHMAPVGNPFLAVSRNISAGGISLLYMRPVPAEFLVVALAAPKQTERRLLMQLQRCRRLGRFYELSGKFVARITD